MGGGTYSYNAYDRLSEDRATKSADAIFVSNTVQKIHPDLDPKGVKVRESRDSTEHPESNAIAVFFDQTGSMGQAPEIMARRSLGRLMKILLSKGYINDPQLLYGCYGDYDDREGVVQVGQFESDLRMDNCLTNMWLVGNGGGTRKESAELALYFMARHTSIDCFEKRGKKGYLFLVTDEPPYEKIQPNQVKNIFGDTLQGPINIEDIIEEVKEKYELFVVFWKTDSYGTNATSEFISTWKKFVGSERVLLLDNPEYASEFIGAAIGKCEGLEMDDIKDSLRDAGASEDSLRATTTALATFTPTKSVAKATASMSGGLKKTSGKPADRT